MAIPKLPTAIFLMGPTASGKTDLAIALRKHLPVEIISVDSAQIYRELNIGSAKPDAQTLSKHPHRLIDIRDPAEPYSVSEFLKDARAQMTQITASGRIPLLVGGSMLYFKILLEGLSDLPEADQNVRKRIQQRADIAGWPSLYDELRQVDPETAARLHPNHSQRIQRALEVYQLTGEAMSKLQARSGDNGIESDYEIVQIALLANSRSLLHQRIETRFYQMMEQGFELEVKTLYERNDLHLGLPAMRSAGYRQLWQYFDGDLSLDQSIDSAITTSRQLAKRQITWLRKWSDAHQIYIDNGKEFLSSKNLCKQCLKILDSVPILK